MSGDRATTPPSSGSGAAPAGCATQTCPDPCATRVFPSREVSENVSEIISNAPVPYTAWNNTYSWTAKFTVLASRNPCGVKVTVKIKIVGTITAPRKAAWKSAIESKWNGKAKLTCPDPACAAACPSGYPISIEVQFVTSGEHYVVNANNPPAGAAAPTTGTSGLNGTRDMGTWGVLDTIDVTHEFGHMLGAPEEYFTTNGTDYTAGGTQPGFRRPGGEVMNNPTGNPAIRNYALIARQAGAAMGLTCTSGPA